MPCVSQPCMQASVHWLPMILTACCSIPTLWYGSSAGNTVMDVELLCALHSFRSSFSICSLLCRAWKWEGSFETCVTQRWAGITQLLCLTCYLALSFSHLYFGERFGYWVCKCIFKPRLRSHDREILADSNNVKKFANSPSHRANHYIESLVLWRKLKQCRSYCVRTPPVLVYYLGYILKNHTFQGFVWRIATSKYNVFEFLPDEWYL